MLKELLISLNNMLENNNEEKGLTPTKGDKTRETFIIETTF